ncbi:MAG: hypothetical protein K9I94_04830 [Bacteroidales bacterium]|nr:hypothetical protein [Bacteroidales bacterium]
MNNRFTLLKSIILSLLLSGLNQHIFAGNETITLALIYPEDVSPQAEKELRAAVDYLKQLDEVAFEKYTLNELTTAPKRLQNQDLIWFHWNDTTGMPPVFRKQEHINRLKEYVGKGGNILLTLEAFPFLMDLDLEKNKPETRQKEARDSGYGRKLGLHAFKSHPVFKGLYGGAYVWKPTSDTTVRQHGFFEDQMPASGNVIAVDWDYIFLRESTKLMVEYKYGKGKVLAVGAYTAFSAGNHNRPHLETFMQNVFQYLGGREKDKREHYWHFGEQKVQSFTPSLDKIPLVPAKTWNTAKPALKLERRFATDNFWDVAGQQMLIMGREKGGIEEIWAHPFMALRDYEVGIRFSYADTIFWLDQEKPQVEIMPEAFSRLYRFRRAYLKEIVSVCPVDAKSTVHYEYRGVYPAELFIRFKSNLRLMWPYSGKVLQGIDYAWDSAFNAFIWKNKLEDQVCVLGMNKRPYDTRIGRYDSLMPFDDHVVTTKTDKFQLYALASFNLEMNDNMDVMISTSTQSLNDAHNAFKALMVDPLNPLKAMASYSKKLLNKHLMIESPDAVFNEGYAWSVVGSDRFFVNTPGVASSLVAGYATTASGWDGEHKVNGRPGYAWYFGRDGQWSGYALLDYGDFHKVKRILETYQDYQDLSGKIYHELTTSGVVHYDASDATPLYIVLAGKYLHHSGDLEFIRNSWPHIEKAIDFCYSTDTDGDHLIENTNVGHGWVEGGSLFGSHTSLYLAGCWAEALEQAEYMATKLGKTALAEKYRNDSEKVIAIINTEFWDEEHGFYYHGKYKDGSYHQAQTIMPAIPTYFSDAEPGKAQKVLNNLASNYYTADWGVRIISEASPDFNPRGYHTGSVWPLYTGWTALAEYQQDRWLQGHAHVMNNLKVYRHWAKGFVEEVLHGKEYKPSGVCRHQCWSETMVLQPALEGMLGLQPDAPEDALSLSPRFPFDWDTVTVKNIAVGDHRMHLVLTKTNGQAIYSLNHSGDNPLVVHFQPALEPGVVVEHVLFDGKPLEYQINQKRQLEEVSVNLEVKQSHKLEISYKPGISVLPALSDPKPGYQSKGIRIIDAYLDGAQYIIETEMLAAEKDQLRLYDPGELVTKVEKAEYMQKEGNVDLLKVEACGEEGQYIRKTIVVHLKNHRE